MCGVADRQDRASCQRKLLERSAGEGKSPVREGDEQEAGIQSTTGHEESGGKTGGPPPKAKYYLVTDREEYREGKVKRTPDRGVKENLKPVAYKRSEPCGVMACLLHNDPTSCLAWRG